MRSSVESLGDNRVKLTVEVDEQEFEPEIEDAFRRIARQVRIPGFRPGRVPRRLLEAKFGRQAGRAEALRSCLGGYYERAVVERGVDAIAPPEIELTRGQERGPLAFDAVVDVRPAVSVSGYEGLRVQIPSPVVGADEIDAEIDAYRLHFAEMRPVSGAAADGNHLRIDIAGSLDGEVVDGLTTSDYDYELGTGAVVPEIDENLRGASAGDILEFDAAHPDGDDWGRLEFRVLVKEVKQTVLPDFDDEFAAANTEYETVEAFRAAMRETRAAAKAAAAAQARREVTDGAVAALVGLAVPEAMIESEAARRLRAIEYDLQMLGRTLEDYFETTGQSEDEFGAELRARAEQAVRLDLALRAVASAEGLEADDDALEAELRRMAATAADGPGAESGSGSAGGAGSAVGSGGGSGSAGGAGSFGDEDVARLRETLRLNGILPQISASLSKQAAMEWIDERVVLVDGEGASVDPELLKPPKDSE